MVAIHSTQENASFFVKKKKNIQCIYIKNVFTSLQFRFFCPTIHDPIRITALHFS